MVQFFLALPVALHASFRARADAALEILALRQQLAVLKRNRPPPPLNAGDRLFWTALRRFWPRWSAVLLIVKPETVTAWHRAGFRLSGAGDRERVVVDRELRRNSGTLIVRLAGEN